MAVTELPRAASAPDRSTSAPTAGEAPAPRGRALTPELLVLLVASAALNLWSLGTNGLANTYYAAAVRTMSSDWHAFLYGAFDPAGLQTVDKPPLALWVEALSVRAFGLSSWSLLAPQALMGVATVALTYDLARRRFGRLAGAVAGATLALTPIAVAIWRHDNPDALLMLCCVAAVWATVRALETGGTRWLVLAGVAVGLGFETKMGAALLVLPGIVAAWLWVAPHGRWAAARALALALAAMTAVALAWPLLISLTPAADRPYVSGTDDDSIWSLILGYNGLGRLFGQAGGPAGNGGAGGVFGGDPGPLRLLNASLGGQAGWLLGVALVGGVAVLAACRLRRPDPRTGWLLVTGGAFLTCAVAFSRADGIFHPYYVAQLAPFTAALAGGGVAELARRTPTARILAPAAIVVGLLAELVVIREAAPDQAGLRPMLVGGAIAAAGALLVVTATRWRGTILAAAVALLLLAPAGWALATPDHATSGTFPAGGPADAGTTGFGGPRGGGGGNGGFGAPPQSPGQQGNRGGGGGGGMFGAGQSLDAALAYVAANGGGPLVVSSQSTAATAILDAGADVAGIGGFSGSETDVSVGWLAQAVADGRVRWVLVSDGGGGGFRDGRVGSSSVFAAVEQVATPVASGDVGGTLYDLQGTADALRALAASS